MKDYERHFLEMQTRGCNMKSENCWISLKFIHYPHSLLLKLEVGVFWSVDSA